MNVKVNTPPGPTLLWSKFYNPAGATRSGLRSVVIGANNEIAAGGFKLANNIVGFGIGYRSSGDLLFVVDNLGQTPSNFNSAAMHPTEDRFFFAGDIRSGEFTSVFLASINNLGGVSESECQEIANRAIFATAIARDNTSLYIGTSSADGQKVITATLDGVLDCRSGFAVRSGSADHITDITVAENHFWVTGHFTGNSGAKATYLRKFDRAGNPLGDETVLQNVGNPRIVEAAEGAESFVYLSGTLFGEAASEQGSVNQSFLLLKLDQNGREAWRREWKGDNASNKQANFAYDLAPRLGGGVVQCGAITKLAAADANSTEVGAVAYNPSGEAVFKIRHQFGTNSDVALSCIVDSAGDLILTGTAYRTNADGDSFVAKFRLP